MIKKIDSQITLKGGIKNVGRKRQSVVTVGVKMKWQYFRVYSSVKREGMFGLKTYRVLDIDGTEYELLEGLNLLGQQGWELVVVHQIDEAYGGLIGSIRDLIYLYLFKKPLP